LARSGSKRLWGSVTPLITPFRDGEVDYVTYANLVERHIKEGGHGVLVNGTTAEPSTLTAGERMRLLETALEVVKDRCPVIAATGSQSQAETRTLCDHATRAGADALLVVTPYYIKPPQRGLIEYFVDIARRTPLPVLIYHIPGRAAISITGDTIAQIRDRAPNLVGMKHAVNDLGFATECLARFGADFRIFVGLEELSFPMMAIGACGLMNAVGNLAPRKVAQLCEAVARGDMNAARALHFELFELNQAVFFDTNPIPIKYMARRLGLLPSNEHRLPMMPATAELERRLDDVLRRSGLLS
jgi:4-hydroxy-tetrahydrodipicolinate synthase